MQAYLLIFLMSILTLRSSQSLPIDTVVTTRYEYEMQRDYYKFLYELSDGQLRFEEGFLREKNGRKFYKVMGFYKFSSDKKTYLINYVSDENGYRPKINIFNDLADTVEPLSPVVDSQVIRTLLG